VISLRRQTSRNATGCNGLLFFSGCGLGAQGGVKSAQMRTAIIARVLKHQPGGLVPGQEGGQKCEFDGTRQSWRGSQIKSFGAGNGGYKWNLKFWNG
jgi:hypothetical protein